MSNFKEACLWSKDGRCVREDDVLSNVERLKVLLKLPSETDNIGLIKKIRIRLEEAPSTEENRNKVIELVTDILRSSLSGCDNCDLKKAAKNSAKYR
jgi:hypothetical protein